MATLNLAPLNDEFRVKTRVFEAGDADWLEKCEEVRQWCNDNIPGSVTSIPGYAPGEVWWYFDNHEAAFWFSVRWA